MKIVPATSSADLAIIRSLFEEYAASIETDLCFQNFAKELASLPGDYAAPRGRVLLATLDGAPAGCVALRPKEAKVCEMKRLYLRPAHQGRGLGRQLAQAIIAEARAIGYESLVLDTLPSMQTALQLYESLGFVRRAPYYDTPVGGTVFLELDLSTR